MATVEERLLHFLASGPAGLSALGRDGKLLLDRSEGKRIGVPAEVLAQAARRGLIVRSRDQVDLTPEGHAFVRRVGAETDGFQAQHRMIAYEKRRTEGEWVDLAVNLNESPLGQLARRKDKDGRAFLEAGEFQAGERLRSDYTRGQIMPRLGANWEAGVASGRRGAGDGMAELTDAALAARLRVEKAVNAVGPELSGILLDVCCFLKGLETVEAERRWPARSAKILLKAALATLARHYAPPRGGTKPRILHWGAANYRPQIAS